MSISACSARLILRVGTATLALTSLAQAGVCLATDETEVEFRIPLSRQGYDRLLENLDFDEERPRVDLYLDILDPVSEGLVLRQWRTGGKLRIMTQPEKSKWQVSYKSSQQTLEVAGFKLRISERVKEEVSSKKEPGLGNLDRRGARIFGLLQTKGRNKGDLPRALAELTSDIAGRPLLLKTLPLAADGLQGCVLPLARVEKDRFKKSIEILSSEVEIQLGRSTFVNGEGRTVTSWEIEAERAGPLAGDEGNVARALVAFLEEHGLSAADTVEPDEKSDLYAWALGRYEENDLTASDCDGSGQQGSGNQEER